MKVAFPSYDVQTMNGRAGGVGAFITQFARLLKENGEDVSIVATRGESHGFLVDQRWRDKYLAWGIDLIEVHNTPAHSRRWPEVWPMRLSEQVAPILGDFDVVYFSDWANVAFQTVRRKRFSAEPSPVCVTVLHGPSNWIRLADRRYPQIPDDLNLEFLERYGARHSDFVIAPSQHMLDWTKSEGWQFQREPEVLGLPFRPEAVETPRKSAQELRRLVFFGRLEARKGYDLFVDALKHLRARSPRVLKQLDEIVLMGHEDVPGAADWVRRELQSTGVQITHLGGLDSLQARDYLIEHVADALVVVPSRFENFPLAVIETSLIPGLNLICTRGGGTPEVLGSADEAQLFDPLPSALAAKISERLARPLPPEALAQYDFEAANERWLAFHQRACEHAAAQPTPPSVRTGPTQPTVDVCVTYYNKAKHFPQLLEALEHQTHQDFGVIAVDDGSTDPEARAAFDVLAKRYVARGWTFFRQENAWVDAARNSAARRSKADYLLMIDADDVLAKNGIERMLEAATCSGDDCLVSGGILFASDDLPYDLASGEVTAPIFAHYMPLGASVVAGILDPAVFGGPVILIRRKVFEEVGGYSEIRGAAHEDWELHARLAMAGYETDVVPEYLHFYRQLDDSLSRTSNDFLAKQRMLEAYDRHLAPARMYGAARAMYALYLDWRKLEGRVADLERQLRDGADRFHAFGFEPTSPEPAPAPENRSPETFHPVPRYFDADNQGPLAIRMLRQFYRRHISLEMRLRLHQRLMKLIRSDRSR